MSELSTPAPAAVSATDRGAFWRGVIFGSLCALIWGIQAVVSRQSVHDGLSAVDVTLLRVGVAGLALLPLALKRARFPVGPLGWRRALVLTALAGTPYSLVLVGGAAFAPAMHSAVIGPGFIPVIAALLGFLVIGERAGPARIIGLILIVAGIAVFSWEAVTGAPSREGAWRGDLLFVATAVMWASFGVLSKRWSVGAIDGTVTICVLSLLTLPLWVPFVSLQTMPERTSPRHRKQEA